MFFFIVVVLPLIWWIKIYIFICLSAIRSNYFINFIYLCHLSYFWLFFANFKLYSHTTEPATGHAKKTRNFCTRDTTFFLHVLWRAPYLPARWIKMISTHMCFDARRRVSECIDDVMFNAVPNIKRTLLQNIAMVSCGRRLRAEKNEFQISSSSSFESSFTYEKPCIHRG